MFSCKRRVVLLISLIMLFGCDGPKQKDESSKEYEGKITMAMLLELAAKGAAGWETAYGEVTEGASDDLVIIQDVSDSTDGAAGTTGHMTIETLLAVPKDIVKLTAWTSEPPSPVNGYIYRADNSGWDPASVDDTDDYFVVYSSEDSAYYAFFTVRGEILISSIEMLEYIPAAIEDQSGNRTLLTSEIKGSLLTNYDAGEALVYDFPVAEHGINFMYCIVDIYAVDLTPYSGKQWYYNGALMTADEPIVNDDPALGECVTCWSMQTGESTWAMFCVSEEADWKQESP